MRRLLPLLFALLLVVAACSSSSDETTTSTLAGQTSGTTEDGGADEGSADDEGATNGDLEVAVDVEAMCRTLTLYSAARVPPQNAAEGMLFVDLRDATSQERAAYGDLLISAPAIGCPAQQRYAEAIQYWLGF